MAIEAGCDPVVVVLGLDVNVAAAEIADLPVRLLENTEWRTGKASSISRGVATLPAQVEGAILLVCDQPHLSAELLQKLIAQRSATKTIVASRYAGTLGVPALFDRIHFGELLDLSGDAGAKALFSRHQNAVAAVDFPGGAIDVDTPADAATLTLSG
jgi:molybdenum cofactor cytidylyltransferase